MEQNQNTGLFGLNLDPSSKMHLAEGARWAKFLAIVGFIMCGLVLLAGIFAGSFLKWVGGNYGEYGDAEISATGFRVMAMVIYILIALIYFFPCLFLFRFASQMKSALASNDQETLNSSFRNLKVMFRYVGIMTIIILCLYAIILLFTIAGGLASGV